MGWQWQNTKTQEEEEPMIKNLLLAIVLLFVFMPIAFAADECPVPEGCDYTASMTYEIYGADGVVLDRTRWESMVGGSFVSQLMMKYAVLSHIFTWREGEVQPEISKRIMPLVNPSP